MNVQLDLFESNDEDSLLDKEMAEMRDSMRRNHKAQFAKLSDMMKFLIQMKEQKDAEIKELYEKIVRLEKLLIKEVK